MSVTDEDIIKGLRQNSPQAMKLVFEHYYLSLCSLARRYTGDAIVAEEIVSDVMYKIWQNRQNDYHSDTFREYLYTATRNTSINYMKQQLSRKKLADKWAEQLRHELIEETPLDILAISELQAKIDQLMADLPDQCCMAFRMSRYDNMTYDEIANEMNISVNTVKYHIKTALHKLRQGLEGFLIWLLFFSAFFIF